MSRSGTDEHNEDDGKGFFSYMIYENGESLAMSQLINSKPLLQDDRDSIQFKIRMILRILGHAPLPYSTTFYSLNGAWAEGRMTEQGADRHTFNVVRVHTSILIITIIEIQIQNGISFIRLRLVVVILQLSLFGFCTL